MMSVPDSGICPTTPSTIEANRELGRAFVEELENAKSPEAFSAVLTRIISPDYIQHNALLPPGRDGLAQFSSALGQSFPDARATLRDVFATADRVVARWTFSGTLTGKPFLGIAATGQKVDFDIIDAWSVKNGQLFEHWDRIDWARGLVQLGVTGLPSPFVGLAGQPVNRGVDPKSGSPELGTFALVGANRELGRAFVEDLENAQSAEGFTRALTSVVSPDYLQHNPLVPPGRDGLAAFLQSLRKSFADARPVLREAFASTDRVVARWTFTGTLTGDPFLGITARGQKLEFDILDVWTLKDGQLFEHWDSIDWTRALVQLGVTGLPAPFTSEAAQPVNR
jgi:predicted ester cyclase